MISRRSLLSGLGAAVATAGTGTVHALSTRSNARSATRKPVIALESFYLLNADRAPHLDAYVTESLLPRMKEAYLGPSLYLHAIVAPRTPQALLMVGFASFEEMIEVRGKVASDVRIQQARARLDSAQILDEVQSEVLIAVEESTQFASSKLIQNGILELRSYHAPGWNQAALQRLDSAFSRSGIHPVVSASTGEHMPRFTYLVPFASLAAREQAWARLEGDAEWIDLQRESAPSVTGKSIYTLASYSRLG